MSHTRRPRAGLYIALAFFSMIAAFTFSGCGNVLVEDHGANQSLVEIGERSLEQAEHLENQGRTSEANLAYRKALWAFRYHERLTHEQPLLLDEALEGYSRTGTRVLSSD